MISYSEAVEKYYNLKNKYEMDKKVKKDNILSLDNITLIEKTKRIRQLKVPCVSCKLDVDTTFIENERKLQAYCGSISHPCPFNIELQKGKYQKRHEVILNLEKTIKKNEDEIVATKLNLICHFVDKSKTIELFESQKKQYTANKRILNTSLEKWADLKAKKRTEINELEKEFKDIIEQLQSPLSESPSKFEKTQHIKEMVSIYINEVEPIGKKLYEMKSDEHVVEEFEIILIEPKVIHFEG